jgi:hypothetical protein
MNRGRDHIRVSDCPDLVREKQSKAILNTNQSELNKYKQTRDEKLKLRSLIEEQQKIRSDLDEIKNILYKLMGQSKS